MKTISFLLLPLLCWPMMVQGAPRPDMAALAASEQAKAVGFLDGVVASYRKLHSLSVKWHAMAVDFMPRTNVKLAASLFRVPPSAKG